MKNNQQQILSEIKSLMASIKDQVEELENKIVEYQQMIEIHEVEGDLSVDEPIVEAVAEPVETEPVEDLMEDSLEEVGEDVVEDVVEEIVEMEVMDIDLDSVDDLPFYDDLPVSEPATELEPLVEAEPETESVVEQDVDDLPEESSEAVGEVVSEPEPVAAPVPVIDAMIAKQPWRTDMPGTPVRDIRSAISLNDRILFINYLFGEDPMAFQEMLTQLNALTSFDEAAAHAIAAHPEWNLESDTVYRFMMALRRRHQ